MILGTPRLRHHSVRVIADSDTRSPSHPSFFPSLPSCCACRCTASKQRYTVVESRVCVISCGARFACAMESWSSHEEGEGPRAASTFLLASDFISFSARASRSPPRLTVSRFKSARCHTLAHRSSASGRQRPRPQSCRQARPTLRDQRNGGRLCVSSSMGILTLI